MLVSLRGDMGSCLAAAIVFGRAIPMTHECSGMNRQWQTLTTGLRPNQRWVADFGSVILL